MELSAGSIQRRGFVGVVVATAVLMSFAGLAPAQSSSGSTNAHVGVSQGITPSGVASSSTLAGATGSQVSGSWAANPPPPQPMDIQVRASDGSQRHNWMVLNNTTDYVQGSPVAPIEFWNVSGIVIEGNHQPMVSDRPSVALYFQDPCNWAVRYNSFPGAEATEPQGVAGSCGWTNAAA